MNNKTKINTFFFSLIAAVRVYKFKFVLVTIHSFNSIKFIISSTSSTDKTFYDSCNCNISNRKHKYIVSIFICLFKYYNLIKIEMKG